jgi:hypothetical protein
MTTVTLRDLAEHDLGLTWVVDEPMRRASHALVDGDRVWLVDPVEAAEPLERAQALGEIAGVIQLLDRHDRDSAALAARFGVPHLSLPDAVPGTPFDVVKIVDVPKWRERALWWPERQALVVAEAVGTGPFFKLREQRLGVHPMLRLTPPRALRRFAPTDLLVGHGGPLHGPETASALSTALDRSRGDLPAMVVSIVRSFR